MLSKANYQDSEITFLKKQVEALDKSLTKAIEMQPCQPKPEPKLIDNPYQRESVEWHQDSKSNTAVTVMPVSPSQQIGSVEMLPPLVRCALCKDQLHFLPEIDAFQHEPRNFPGVGITYPPCPNEGKRWRVPPILLAVEELT